MYLHGCKGSLIFEFGRFQSHCRSCIKIKHKAMQCAFTNIYERVGRFKKLTELECGTVIGYSCYRACAGEGELKKVSCSTFYWNTILNACVEH